MPTVLRDLEILNKRRGLASGGKQRRRQYMIHRRFAPVSKISNKIQHVMKDTHTNR
jgi:hypothetical protein